MSLLLGVNIAVHAVCVKHSRALKAHSEPAETANANPTHPMEHECGPQLQDGY